MAGCDLVRAAGLTPDTGLSYLLPRVVGAHRATELALLGRTLDAQTAREWGDFFLD